MIGFTQTIGLVVGEWVTVRGVRTADFSDPTIVENVPAAVYYTKTGADFEHGVQYSEEVRVLLEPRDVDLGITRIRWMGADYSITEAPRTRFRYGKPHHLSITLGSKR